VAEETYPRGTCHEECSRDRLTEIAIVTDKKIGPLPMGVRSFSFGDRLDPGDISHS
jgi:hypothetical protein